MRGIATFISAPLRKTWPRYVASASWSVLDYGCGEALSADLVAARAARLTLVEPAPGVRARIAARFRDHAKIEVAAPDDLAKRPDASFDLIIMHSVAQYLTPDELDATFVSLRRLLKGDGMFVLGDVLQPGASALTDALALLRFGAAPRLPRRCHAGAAADLFFELLAVALLARPDPLWARADDRKAGRRAG